MRFLGLALFVASSVVASVLPACSSKTSDTCQAYATPAGFDATTPAVTLTVDVQKIFARSCVFSSCHGSEGGSNQAGLYLGTDPARLVANVVGVKASNFTMNRVTAGDPANSYLMHKIDGDTCTLPACSGTCLETMPQDSDLMAVSDRDTIRRWIAQGAKND